MAIEIQIDEKTKDNVINEQFNGVDKIIQNEFAPDVLQLKTAAQLYLSELEIMKIEIDNFKTLLKRQKEIRKNFKKDYNTIDEYIQNREIQSTFLHSDIPKRFYQATFKFQEELNKCLGQEVVMVYVYENSDGEPELYEIKNEDVLRFDVASRTANFTARYQPSMKDFGSSLQRLQTDSVLNFNLSNLQNTYKEMLFRYRSSRKKNNRIVLWENPINVWNHVWISTEGDIAETYAVIVLLNRQSPGFQNTNMELNVEEFAMETLNVDNMSGMLAGDVTVGNIEYGIKTAGASVLSANQLIKMAKKILKESDFDKKKLLTEKEKMAKRARKRNKLIKGVENQVSSDIQDIIDMIKST